MKTASAQLQSFLSTARTGNAALVVADCFTITTLLGAVSYVTNWDQDIVWRGHTFVSKNVIITGLRAKVSTGLEVDRQQITVAAQPGSTFNGASWMEMIRAGGLDGATIQRDRVFISPVLTGGIDGVTMFLGYVSAIDQVGRTSAKVTVASALVVLDYDFPRNMFLPTCAHTLYDAGCSLTAAAFATAATVGVGSDVRTILSSQALAAHAQGTLVVTSGSCGGIRSTVQLAVAGVSWTLTYPLPVAPNVSDSLIVYMGCDHTVATCTNRFSNAAHFRGFPLVPPPDYAF